MRSHFLTRLLAVVLLIAHLPASADDIDLFLQPRLSATDIPNVLILLDNTANWNTAFTNEIAALVTTVSNLPVNADGSAKFRVGLMLFTETGGSNSNDDGGYVRAAVRPLTSANKTKYMALLNSLDRVADKSNGGKAGKTMVEAYRYWTGSAPYAGNNKVKTDYRGNTSGTAASNAIYALPDNALTTKAGTQYLSPVLPDSCARNFIIYISNGAVQDNSSDTRAATDQLVSAANAVGITGATTAIPISPSGSADNVGDEWARFLYQSNDNIITYTLDVDKVTNGQGPGWTALLRSMAGVSNGKYFDVSSGSGGVQISDALAKIFSEIQAVNSVFASVSLPVSVSIQGTYLNQVYVGMFRPDADALPRWAGNLKQYKVGKIGNTLKLLDAAGSGAINANTGFITECGRSFWTPTTLDNYWWFRPQGGCLAVANSNQSNTPDGNIVEKGGQAYKLRAWANTYWRTVKTCPATLASCTGMTDFNNTNVTQTQLGASSTTERDKLINWQKGQDVDDERVRTWFETMRPSAHGDVLHSRPVALNYGTDGSPEIVVFYGGNDGMLRAVNGNRSASIDGVSAGDEFWSFVPPEFYTSIKRLRDNTTAISFLGSTGTRLPKPYGVDGPVTALQDAYDASPRRAWIYAGMRRGGRVLYSFDVTDPASPSLKWKRGCPNQGDDTNCTTGLTGIGQTWSPPRTLKASGYGSGSTPLLILGGGYDPCEDGDPNTCTSSAKGRHIYVLNADTGTLLKTFDTDRAVAGDIIVIPDASTGLAKWAYAADLGGNIYRLSGATANAAFGDADPASWTITKIASLGCDTPASCTANRKFMFGPDVVGYDGSYVLLIGSGDREKPITGFTSAYGVTNYFFRLRDQPANADWLSSENANCSANLLCLSSLLPIATATPDQASLDTKKGWYLGLSAHEQVVTSSVTVFGVTTFSTHTPAVPAAGACTSHLGTTKVYNIDFLNAATANGSGNRFELVSGGGLPPSPVAGMVRLDDGEIVPFVIGASPESSLEVKLAPPPPSASQPKNQIYWYIQQ